MARPNPNGLYVFKEQSFLFGILPSDFDSYLPLNKLWISPSEKNPLLWKYEKQKPRKQGYFTHLAALFGFNDIRFSQSGIVFQKSLSKNVTFGLVLNEFLMQIVYKKIGPKMMTIDVVKNFPPNLPKAVFQSVQRYKRKNILVLSLQKLVEEFQIEWPSDFS